MIWMLVNANNSCYRQTIVALYKHELKITNNKYIDLTTQEEFYGKNAKETSGDLAFMRNACRHRSSGRVCYNW